MARSNGEYHLNLLSRKSENIAAIEKTGCRLVIQNYLTTLVEAIEVLPGTILCHLDAALRHLPAARIDEEYLPQIKEVLQAVKVVREKRKKEIIIAAKKIADYQYKVGDIVRLIDGRAQGIVEKVEKDIISVVWIQIWDKEETIFFYEVLVFFKLPFNPTKSIIGNESGSSVFIEPLGIGHKPF